MVQQACRPAIWAMITPHCAAVVLGEWRRSVTTESRWATIARWHTFLYCSVAAEVTRAVVIERKARELMLEQPQHHLCQPYFPFFSSYILKQYTNAMFWFLLLYFILQQTKIPKSLFARKLTNSAHTDSRTFLAYRFLSYFLRIAMTVLTTGR